MSPLVSIGIPTYNKVDFLKQAILTVLRQGWRNLEIIVVDDCSTDNTPEVVREFKDPRIRYHRTERNLRPPRSLNVCARLARGEFFAILPHDDVYLPDFLETMVGALQRHPKVGFAQCAFCHVDSEIRPKGLKKASEVPFCLSGADALIWQMERLLCNPAAVLFRMSKMRELGFWREDYWDDWAFTVRMAYHHGFVFVPDILAGVREHQNNLSTVLGREGRDGALDIINQQADVFGQALPMTPRLLAFRSQQERILSYSCVVTAWRAVLRGRWRQARFHLHRAVCLHACAPVDPRIVMHVWRGLVYRWRKNRLTKIPGTAEPLLKFHQG